MSRLPVAPEGWPFIVIPAAIAAGLARGQALGDAIRSAKAYVTRAIREGFQAGRGVGQLRHFIPDW